MSARGLLVGVGVLVLAFALFLALMVRQALAPQPTPTRYPSATPTPEPFDPPVPEDDDLEIPTLPKIAVCCCQMPGGVYGECDDRQMVRQAARGHALRHGHDLIGRRCATPTEEALALRRVLHRPERIEGNSAATLAMADRAAWRERMSS